MAVRRSSTIHVEVPEKDPAKLGDERRGRRCYFSKDVAEETSQHSSDVPPSSPLRRCLSPAKSCLKRRSSAPDASVAALAAAQAAHAAAKESSRLGEASWPIQSVSAFKLGDLVAASEAEDSLFMPSVGTDEGDEVVVAEFPAPITPAFGTGGSIASKASSSRIRLSVPQQRERQPHEGEATGPQPDVLSSVSQPSLRPDSQTAALPPNSSSDPSLLGSERSQEEGSGDGRRHMGQRMVIPVTRRLAEHISSNPSSPAFTAEELARRSRSASPPADVEEDDFGLESPLGVESPQTGEDSLSLTMGSSDGVKKRSRVCARIEPGEVLKCGEVLMVTTMAVMRGEASGEQEDSVQAEVLAVNSAESCYKVRLKQSGRVVVLKPKRDDLLVESSTTLSGRPVADPTVSPRPRSPQKPGRPRSPEKPRPPQKAC